MVWLRPSGQSRAEAARTTFIAKINNRFGTQRSSASRLPSALAGAARKRLLGSARKHEKQNDRLLRFTVLYLHLLLRFPVAVARSEASHSSRRPALAAGGV